MRLSLYGPLTGPGHKCEQGKLAAGCRLPCPVIGHCRQRSGSLASVAPILCSSGPIVTYGWSGNYGFFKVQLVEMNVKEFRRENSTLKLDLFLSKNLDHLRLSKKRGLGIANPQVWGLAIPKNPLYGGGGVQKVSSWTPPGYTFYTFQYTPCSRANRPLSTR